MNCPDCGSILVVIHAAEPLGPNVKHYRHTCGYCNAKVEIIVHRLQPGLPENIREVRDWLFQDRPRSQR